jgi:acetyl-CoA synthetase
MNLGGIKVSSLELERAINRVPGVRESAAVACSREGGPDSLVVFLVLDPSSEESSGGSGSAAGALLPPAGEALTTKQTLTAGPAGEAAAACERQWVATLNHAIRQQINPLFKVAEVVIVPQLPRTASNKILRRRLRDQWRQGPSHFPER